MKTKYILKEALVFATSLILACRSSMPSPDEAESYLVESGPDICGVLCERIDACASRNEESIHEDELIPFCLEWCELTSQADSFLNTACLHETACGEFSACFYHPTQWEFNALNNGLCKKVIHRILACNPSTNSASVRKEVGQVCVSLSHRHHLAMLKKVATATTCKDVTSSLKEIKYRRELPKPLGVIEAVSIEERISWLKEDDVARKIVALSTISSIAWDPMQSGIDQHQENKGSMARRLEHDIRLTVSGFLQADNLMLRLASIKALYNIAMGSESLKKVVAQTLLPLLDDPDETVRDATIDTIQLIDASSEAFFDRLQKMSKSDPSENIRKRAAEFVRSMNPPVDDVLKALGGEDASKKNTVLRALLRGKKRSRPETEILFPAILAVLSGNDTENKELAIEILGKFGPLAKEAIPILIDTMTDEKSYTGINHAVKQALKQMGAAVNKLILARLGSNKFIEKISVVELAGELKVTAAAPLLKEIVFGPQFKKNEDLRTRATEALIQTKGDDFTEYVSFLSDEDIMTTVFAIRIIRSYGERVIPFIVEKMKTITNMREMDSCISILSVGKNSNSAAEALIDVMNDKKQDSAVRRNARWALSENHKAEKHLLWAIKSNDKETIQLAMRVFARMGRNREVETKHFPEKVVPHLKPFLKSTDEDLRSSAVFTIGYFAPHLDEFNDIAVNDPSESIRKMAQELLETAR